MYSLLEGFTEDTIKQVYKDHIQGITQELGLNKIPEINIIYHEESQYVMHIDVLPVVTNNIVEAVFANNIININLKNTNAQCSDLYNVCGTEVAKEAILFFLRHECRHIWQAENSFRVGVSKEDFLEEDIQRKYGHGASTLEKDANDFAVSGLEGKEKLLGELIVLYMSSTGIHSNRVKVVNKALEVAEAYKPFHAKIMRLKIGYKTNKKKLPVWLKIADFLF